jgi:NCAIR mutase (PurE)-related protein
MKEIVCTRRPWRRGKSWIVAPMLVALPVAVAGLMDVPIEGSSRPVFLSRRKAGRSKMRAKTVFF